MKVILAILATLGAALLVAMFGMSLSALMLSSQISREEETHRKGAR